MDIKSRLIDEQRKELTHHKCRLEEKLSNLLAIDSRILSPDRPFFEFFNEFLRIIKAAYNYLDFILQCEPPDLDEYERSKSEIDIELTPAESMEDIREHKQQILECKLDEILNSLSKLNEKITSTTNERDKRELKFEYRMLGILVEGLMNIPIDWAGGSLKSWTKKLHETKLEISEKMSKLQPNDYVDATKNPLLYILSSLNTYEEELKRINLIDLDSIQDIENIRFYLQSLESLNRCVSKLRNPLSKIYIQEEYSNQLQLRTNTLQDKLNELIQTTSK